MQQRDAFVNNMSERLLAYALGRGLEYFDRPATHRIADTTKKDDYRMRTMIHAITESYPFQFRRNAREGR